jgi:hypothetical protein
MRLIHRQKFVESRKFSSPPIPLPNAETRVLLAFNSEEQIIYLLRKFPVCDNNDDRSVRQYTPACLHRTESGRDMMIGPSAPNRPKAFGNSIGFWNWMERGGTR